MGSQFKESRGKRLLEMYNSDQNKENQDNNHTEDLVVKPGTSTDTALNDMDTFSEDDDDSVKKNYKSSSSSRSSSSSSRLSSSSSSSSKSSSRSFTGPVDQNISQSTRMNNPQLLDYYYYYYT